MEGDLSHDETPSKRNSPNSSKADELKLAEDPSDDLADGFAE